MYTIQLNSTKENTIGYRAIVSGNGRQSLRYSSLGSLGQALVFIEVVMRGETMILTVTSLPDTTK